MSVERLTRAAESVARGLRVIAGTAPGTSRARLFVRWAIALENAVVGIVGPEEHTPPGGTWLGEVSRVAMRPDAWLTEPAMRFALRRLSEARTLLKLAHAAVSFAGELEHAAAIERWLERIDEGPPSE